MKNVIISKQEENSENYERFLEIVKQRNTKVLVVKAGDIIKIDGEVYFDVLFPEREQIQENILNNNSIVAKLVYRDFSLLFTGDIEEIAEKRIVEKYSNTNKLNASILKVAHHGSKTSSTIEFLNMVTPKVALIGVGNNNKFGHPNEQTLVKLKDINCKIYRTDLNGEVNIIVKHNGKIKIRRLIK